MDFRVPPTSNYVQMAAVERATGIWDQREHTFYFQMLPGITKAFMEFSGILGHYQFDFDTSQCTGSFVGWGDYNYDYESDRYPDGKRIFQVPQGMTTHYQSPISATKSQIR